jgi:hypothetical protein
MNVGLTVLRGLVVIILFLAVLYLVNPNVEIWCGEQWEAAQAKYEELSKNLRDMNYNVPLAVRRSADSVKAHYERREEEMLQHLLGTRSKYKTQHHVGSVMQDGFHVDLPPDAMWQNHTIVRGIEIQALSEAKAKEKPAWLAAKERQEEATAAKMTKTTHST